MHQLPTRHRCAQVSLLLVMLVVFLCSGQRAGLILGCPFKVAAAVQTAEIGTSHAMAPQHSPTQHKQTTDVEKSCDLTDHLLQLHQQSLGHALLYAVTLLLLLPQLIGTPYRVPLLTEPIPPPRRRHLTFCVFRE
ncbi:hypothetical protein [Photobacterium atrarenae]|uniref:Copper resistance protein n=1 Tax=Photobacterium atrarenae TaxID=865757 RepID=A0ABY5GKD8_9GAMM|nr:hypothetical protein [Photobacterium atrarenae]UTV29779.1 hypothetical protein NNL38_22485 [Photobacterium atrarenae]